RLVFDNLGAPFWSQEWGCVVPLGMTQPRGGGLVPPLEFFESCSEGDRFLKSDSLVLIFHPGCLPACGLAAGADKQLFLKCLILAQNERWRRGLGMQVERIPPL